MTRIALLLSLPAVAGFAAGAAAQAPLFGPAQVTSYDEDKGEGPYVNNAVFADLDGDGYADLVGPGGVAWGLGDGTFEPVQRWFEETPRERCTVSAAVGDVNGDGLLDVFVEDLVGDEPEPEGRLGSVCGARRVLILLNEGGRAFSLEREIATGELRFDNRSMGRLRVADLDGDGRPDLLHGIRLDGGVTAGLLATLAGPDLAYETTIRFEEPIFISIVGFSIADFDGDGVPDVLSRFGDEVSVRFGDGAGGFERIETVEQPRRTFVGGFVGAFDADGDGDTDAALSDDAFVVFLNDGSGHFSAGIEVLDDDEPTAPFATADFDGDGRDDLAFPDPGLDDEVAQVFTAGEGVAFEARQTVRVEPQTQWSRVETPDLNGDGRPDLVALAVTSWNEGRVVAALNVRGACPADLDGDGDVDARDLGAVITAWGAGASSADLNGDGRVSGDDVAVVIAAWGPCE